MCCRNEMIGWSKREERTSLVGKVAHFSKVMRGFCGTSKDKSTKVV